VTMRLIKSRLVMFVLMLAVASTAAAASPAKSRSAKRVNRTTTTVTSPSATATTPKIKAPVTRQITTESDSSCSWLYYQCSWGISDTACTKLAICNVKNATGNGGVYAE
jgi:hypothetical protein